MFDVANKVIPAIDTMKVYKLDNLKIEFVDDLLAALY